MSVDSLLAILKDYDLVEEPFIVIREISFRLGTLRTPITIKLYIRPEQDGVWFWQSHFICIPGQADPYSTGSDRRSNEESALKGAIGTLIQWYKSATDNGQQPDESWLVLNEDPLL